MINWRVAIAATVLVTLWIMGSRSTVTPPLLMIPVPSALEVAPLLPQEATAFTPPAPQMFRDTEPHEFPTVVLTRQGKKRPAAAKRCAWRFVAYHPSLIEQQWRANIAYNQHHVCEATSALPGVGAWLDLASQLAQTRAGRNCEAPQPTLPPPKDSIEGNVLSQFEYEWYCPTEAARSLGGFKAPVRVPIEPLVGPLRDPRVCTVDKQTYLVSREYLVTSDWAAQNVGNPPNSPSGRQAYYFDVGASTWNSGLGGPSQPYFLDQIEQQCLSVSGMFAWEATPTSPEVVWSQIPGRLRPSYRWFNIRASPGDDWDNPLQHLLATASPEDYVLFKLDIDTNEVEEAIVRSLLASPEALALIDEFYWEHHVNFAPVNYDWGLESYNKFMNSSLPFFSALRHAGVRAHSWT